MARKRKNKPTKYQIAIVGEGITEWHYFNDLKQVHKFPYKISPELPKNSNYKSIFKKAVQLLEEGYDKVYCVLDVDIFKQDKKEEQKYLNKKRKLSKNTNISIIETMPCIEYWFLLHFIAFSAKIYPSYNSLEKALKTFLPNYEKSSAYLKKNHIYQTLVKLGDIENAKEIASKLRQMKEESDNHLFPYTEIDLLLSEL